MKTNKKMMKKKFIFMKPAKRQLHIRAKLKKRIRDNSYGYKIIRRGVGVSE